MVGKVDSTTLASVVVGLESELEATTVLGMVDEVVVASLELFEDDTEVVVLVVVVLEVAIVDAVVLEVATEVETVVLEVPMVVDVVVVVVALEPSRYF